MSAKAVMRLVELCMLHQHKQGKGDLSHATHTLALTSPQVTMSHNQLLMGCRPQSKLSLRCCKVCGKQFRGGGVGS